MPQTRRIAAVRDTGERSPLLGGKRQPETYVAIADGCKEFPDESDPKIAQELQALLSLVYPVVLTTGLEFLPGFTCIILAGHIDSPHTQQYVDAATLSTMFMNITASSVGSGLSSALDTLCSQAYGAKRFDKIGVYFQAGFLVVGACFVPIFLLNWYSGEFLLLVGQDPEVARMAQSFSRWAILGVPFVFLYKLFRKVLQAQSIMKPLVAIAAIGSIVNAVSGYLLTYHTSMGFEGIALSRSLGNMVLPLMLMPYFYCCPHHLSQWWRGWNWSEASAHVGLFLRLGVPSFLMVATEWWAFEMLTLMAGVLPNAVVSVSAHAVQVNVNNMIYMVFWGLAVASNVRIGNCLGANSPNQAKLACKVAQLLTLSISVVFAVSMYVFRGVIPSLFLTERESIDRSASLLAIWAPFEILDGQNTVLQGVYRGLGKQKVAATVSAVAFYACGIPAAALFGFRLALGVEGLWLGFGFGTCTGSAKAHSLVSASAKIRPHQARHMWGSITRPPTKSLKASIMSSESFACSRHKKQTHLQYSKHISLLAIAAVALLAATIVSKTWVIDVPARVGFFTAHQTDVPTTRLLRAYGVSNEDKEERVGLSGLVQAGTSKIDDLVMSRKYKSLVKKLQLDDGFVAVLKKPHLENLNQLVTKFNRGKKLKKQISLNAPLSAKYGDDAVARTLVELERNADIAPELAKLVNQLRGEQLTEW
ncbi:hypothetical protein PC118_g1491 [Phytophthora cactorum]|uniref:Multi antimicrobial extrusion protein n=2 Tax=Phytophthora cactorum TaxID=29920 RepID=A0A8T1GN43_9STRA|nr:hypothetical protein PC118_g1491 [Phytophthora cactorum]